MWLLNKPVRGKGIRHVLGGNRFPKKIDDNELLVLVQRLRNGDDTVKTTIIEGHIRLAISIASKYATMTNCEQELVSEACFAIIDAVDKAKEKLVDNNITPWIAYRIHRYCHKFIVDEKRQLASNMTIKRNLEVGRHTSSVRLYNESDTVAVDTFTRKTQPLSGKNCTTVREIKDEIDYAIKMEEDEVRRNIKKAIIRLRTLGYNDQEIAQMLHKSPSFISKLRTELREIFNQIENE